MPANPRDGVTTGACLCGAVRFEIRAPLGSLVYCHCAQSRKAQGIAFAANAPVPSAALHVVAGADAVTEFRSSASKRRFFCRVCGSPLYSRVDGADVLRIRAGVLDADARPIPAAHIFVDSKAPWDVIRDDLPRYPAREPGR